MTLRPWPERLRQLRLIPHISRPPAYEGRVERIEDGHAFGWAWDPRDPGRRLPVVVDVDGEVVAEAVAEIPRGDLRDQGIGDGAHGFEIPLPETLQASTEVRLVVRMGGERSRVQRSSDYSQQASADGPWAGTRFRYGRAGEIDDDDEDVPVLPPPPEPALRRAVVGRDGWLYDAAEFEPMPAPTTPVVERLVESFIELDRQCAAIGVAYVPAWVPRKLSVTRDAEPNEAETDSQWVTALRARLRDVDRVDLIDLLPVIGDASRHGPTFDKTDPGWNDRGAFFAARALVKEAGKRVPNLTPLPVDSLRLRERAAYRGALADLTKLRYEEEKLVPSDESVPDETVLEADASYLHARRVPAERHLVDTPPVHVRLYEQSKHELKTRLSIVGLSACLRLLPWLAESAHRTSFFWTTLPPMEPIELELPDALLHLISYRDVPVLCSTDES